MDEKRSILTLIKKHWRKFLIVFIICFGGGLVFSAEHFIPIVLDMIVINPYFNDQVSSKPPHPPLIIPPPEPENHQVFLPIVSNYEHKQERAQFQEPVVQTRLNEERDAPVFDINFKDGSPPVKILLDPHIEQNHALTPVEISFLPGEHCIFGDGYACVYEFISSAGKSVTFISVHSGLGGEGDDLRNLFEGTGINLGLFEPAQVMNIAQSLSGSAIEIKQDNRLIKDLTLSAVSRIPPEHFTTYTMLPIEEALDFAIEITSIDPSILNQDLLIIETCGWRLPGEEQIVGLNVTSSSVYLAIVSLENYEIVKN